MLLDDADRAALVEAVHDYAASELAPLTERPEVPVVRGDIDARITALTAMGVLSGDAAAGLGLWDSVDEPAACRLSLDILVELAVASPGVAYEIHLRGLASHLDRRGSLDVGGATLTVEASVGPVSRSTGRAFAGAELLATDEAELADAWGIDSPRLHVGPAAWTRLWWPFWSSSAGWGLRRIDRDEADVADLPHGHGLDEARYQRVGPGPNGAADVTDVASGTMIFDAGLVTDVVACHAAGLLAISVGTARRATDRARAYSRSRVQGGARIGEHDAVAELLAGAEHRIAAGRALLDHVAALPAGTGRLHQAWRARAQAQPLLSAAGDDALQVFGGIGYMRDVGAEKDQRDLNALRRLGGSPSDLTLRCAALDDRSAP